MYISNMYSTLCDMWALMTGFNSCKYILFALYGIKIGFSILLYYIYEICRKFAYMTEKIAI